MIAKVPLGEVVDIAMGAAPPGESYNLTKQGIPMIAGAGDYGEKYPNPKNGQPLQHEQQKSET